MIKGCKANKQIPIRTKKVSKGSLYNPKNINARKATSITIIGKLVHKAPA